MMLLEEEDVKLLIQVWSRVQIYMKQAEPGMEQAWVDGDDDDDGDVQFGIAWFH